jgi:hypothetical protein
METVLAATAVTIPVAGAADIPDPRLRGLFEHWDARRGERAMPARRDIDVIELAPWLGHLMLIDVLDAGREFRYRVYGSTLAEYYGHDFTGRTTEAVRPEARELVRREYRDVIAGRRPLLVLRDRKIRYRTMRVAKLALPLSTDGIALDMLLVGSYPLE